MFALFSPINLQTTIIVIVVQRELYLSLFPNLVVAYLVWNGNQHTD